MKALFTAIRNREIENIQRLIEKKPELVNCVAKAPPKKDDGLSPLQVAFKTFNIWAVRFFIEHGADVNYMDQSEVNTWNMPVLHDAVMAIVALARFEYPIDPWDKIKKSQMEIRGKKENFDAVLMLLEIMIEKGVDVNSQDSKGNTVLHRACLDVENRRFDQHQLSVATLEDVRQLFQLLIKYGADLNQATTTRESVIKLFPNLFEELDLKIRE
ncbi:ankyrin repeat domain-containing protein [Acinetobacter guillouiae]|uniref:ankyrin repeat domain-containing protein n=1 Tax=Acinetobacter guillouiae TaxID=106649 RepID=UPI003AF41C37